MKKNFKYKGLTVNGFGLLVSSSNMKKSSKSKKSQRKYSEYKHFDYNFPITALKDTIVMFDLPSAKRSERDWFRYQLKGFNYSLIQKGVWVGPSPLPKEFVSYAESIGFLNKLKILKLARPY